jgi:hypothetical protein
VPAVAALVTVELAAGRVLVDAVPGLLDPEGSGRRGPGNPEGVPRSDEDDLRGGAPVGRE